MKARVAEGNNSWGLREDYLTKPLDSVDSSVWENCLHAEKVQKEDFEKEKRKGRLAVDNLMELHSDSSSTAGDHY